MVVVVGQKNFHFSDHNSAWLGINLARPGLS
jgi:hypothetical protein